MMHTTTLILDDDSFLKKVCIGFRLAFNQEKIIGVLSRVQHIESMIEMKEAMGVELLDDIQEQAAQAAKELEDLL